MKSKRHKAPEHDHARCIKRAVAAAERLCTAKALTLTPIRRRVLEVVWRAHAPIGAYEILSQISVERGKTDPPTIYRALEFLKNAGLIHRLGTLNAFLGCEHPEDTHAGQFLICGNCRRVEELERSVLDPALRARVKELGFALEDSVVEIKSLCDECAQAA